MIRSGTRKLQATCCLLTTFFIFGAPVYCKRITKIQQSANRLVVEISLYENSLPAKMLATQAAPGITCKEILEMAKACIMLSALKANAD